MLDTGVLEVGLRPAAGGGREPAGQGAPAHAELGRELGYPERVVKVEVDVLLDPVDDHVAVRSFTAERDVGALAGPVAVDQQNLGGQIRTVVTGETF